MAKKKHDAEEKRDLLVLTTGGTIDRDAKTGKKVYVPAKPGSLSVDVIREIAGNMPECGNIRVVPICDKFSNNFDMEDYRKMWTVIREAKESRVLVTMGTAFMREWAMFLSQNIQNKVVVVTGALTPLNAGKEESDGYKNLAHAVEVALHSAKNGVWIVMHSMVFNGKKMAQKIKEDEPGPLVEGKLGPRVERS